MEHPEQPWPVRAVTWSKGSGNLQDNPEKVRRVRAFLRSHAACVFGQACHDWAKKYKLRPPLVFTWDLDDHDHDMLVLEWSQVNEDDAGLPDGVTPDTALLALSAWCCSRLRTAGVSVNVERWPDPNDPDDPEYVAYAAYVFTIERPRRTVRKTPPAKGADRE